MSRSAALNQTQHPSLVKQPASKLPGQQQPAVAVKLFQFDGARSASGGYNRPVVVQDHDTTAFSAVARPSTSHDVHRRNPHHSPAGNKPGTAALRPLTSPPSPNKADQQQQQQQPQTSALEGATAGISGTQIIPHPSSAGRGSSSVVMQGNATAAAAATTKTTDAAVRAGSAASSSQRHHQQQQQQHNNTRRGSNSPSKQRDASAKSRATSTDMMYSRFKARGGGAAYGPEVTQINILHTRHKIQFEYGRLRRLQSGELGAMLTTLKRGIKSAGRIWAKEDDLRMSVDHRRNSDSQQNLHATLPPPSSATAGGGDAAPGPLRRSASAARVAALAAERESQLTGKDALAAEFGEDEAPVGSGDADEDDAIERAFRNNTATTTTSGGGGDSRPHSGAIGQPPRSASSAKRRPGSGAPSSANSQQQQQQQHRNNSGSASGSRQQPPRAATAGSAHSSGRGGGAGAAPASEHSSGGGSRRAASAMLHSPSPTASAIHDPNTFRGATASLERSYLDTLGSMLSPSAARQRRNASAASLQRQQQQHRQQQRARSTSPTDVGTAPTATTKSQSGSMSYTQLVDADETPNILTRKTALGARNRSPLTTSILRSFAPDAVKETRTPSAAKSRPASADHLLSGTRWHRDVENGVVPCETATNPADLPRPIADARLEQLPEELRFYAVHPSSPRRYNSQPPPSYFFEAPALPAQKQEDSSFSPEAIRQNDIFQQLAMPSRFRAGSAANVSMKSASAAASATTMGAAAGAAVLSSPGHNSATASPGRTSNQTVVPAAATAVSDSAADSPMSPGTAHVLAAKRVDAQMRDRIASLSKTKGIVDYLHERKQQCFCQYSSVIKRKLLELRAKGLVTASGAPVVAAAVTGSSTP